MAETERMRREVKQWRSGPYPTTEGMLSQGQDVTNWTERFVLIPEGKDGGKPLELLDFQKDVIRTIYDNDGTAPRGGAGRRG